MRGNRFVASVILVLTFLPAGHLAAQEGDHDGSAVREQHTSGVIARVGIEDYPIGCSSSLGHPTDANPWTSKSGSNRCSIATREDNVDGLMILVDWSTLQPNSYNAALSSYYIDNAIYSLAHPERQRIHLAVLAGTHSPDWLINPPPGTNVSFPDTLGGGTCDAAVSSSGGPTKGVPGKIWNLFSFGGTLMPMPNPFASNSCLFSALDNLVYKLGQSGDYNYPNTSSYPPPLAPYDDLYYDNARGKEGFVHTNSPTATMNKIIGHVSVLGPHSYDGESVLCSSEADCKNTPANSYNYGLWRSLQADDFSMEAAIEGAQERTMDIYTAHFPNTYWTTDLVERQMPFFDATGCDVSPNPYPPTPGPLVNDYSDCFGKLRTDLIAYAQAHYSGHGGVQNNSLSPDPDGLTNHPVWIQTARAAQQLPINPVQLFVGLQVGDPGGFYQAGDTSFSDFKDDDQTAVNRANQMLLCYEHVDFIEFYDVEISQNFTLPLISGGMSPNSQELNHPATALNDDPGGFMYMPLTDAHRILGRSMQEPSLDCHSCPCEANYR